MNLPPPELIWIGIIASLLSIIWQTANLIVAWRNRARITFKTLSASTYTVLYSQWELDNAHWVGAPHERPYMKPTDCKTAFIIVEFAVTNQFPTEIAVGRFIIDGWMFSDHHTRGVYGYTRDYQAFDLHTRARTSLDTFVRIPPKGSVAYRIEILEQADGPNWVSSKSRYIIDLPRFYNVRFHTTVGERSAKIRLPRRPTPVFGDLPNVYHWSTLIGTGVVFLAPIPQGLEPYTYPWLFRFFPQHYTYRIQEWFRAQRNRIARMIRKMQKRG